MDDVNREYVSTAATKEGFISADLSVWVLLASNLVAIVWAYVGAWELGTVMWAYWIQSVSIGLTWFVKIMALREFSTKGFKINDQSVQPTAETRVKTAFFFLIHYGFFHLVYCSFLVLEQSTEQTLSIILIGAVFGGYQVFSFFYNRKWVTPGKPNIGKMMFFPYARVIPMHLTIMAGGKLLESQDSASAARMTLLLFMALKTAADLVMHLVERRGFSDRPGK